MMLRQLNQIFLHDKDAVICIDSTTNSPISIAQFQSDVSRCSNIVKESEAEAFWLHSSNTYLFAVGLITLLGLNKRVVISANYQPEWIDSISNEFDAMLNDCEIERKHCVVYRLESGNLLQESWVPNLSGKERITFFTSGSTGVPKASHKSLQQLLNEVATLEKAFADVVGQSTFVSSVSHLHIYGCLFKLLWPLCTLRVWENNQIDYPEQLVSLSTRTSDIVFVSSPAFLARLDLHLEPITANVIFSSGGPLSVKAAKQVFHYFEIFPLEVYGSTETGGIAFRNQKDDNELWTLFDKVTIKLIDDQFLLYSPHLGLNEEVRIDDRLKLDVDGKFVLLGRSDRIVKIEEKRVSLTEIENFLKSFDVIQDCVAMLVPGNREVIGCVVVLNEKGNICKRISGFSELVKEWKRRMVNRFEAITIPRKWREVDAIPVNSQSKIDVAKLLLAFKPGVGN